MTTIASLFIPEVVERTLDERGIRYESSSDGGYAFFTREDTLGNTRHLVVTPEGEVILDTRDSTGEPIEGMPVIRITNPSLVVVETFVSTMF